MQTIKLFISIFLLTTIFTACSSKVQTQVVDSNKEDISKLLKTLINKEQEINKLNQKLEDCKEK
jgi:cell division protein FtsB